MLQAVPGEGEEGRAWAPLMGPHYLPGYQLGGKSKYSLFLTRFLSSLELSSHNGALGWGNPQSYVAATRGLKSEGVET